jgi:hypothetical protein
MDRWIWQQCSTRGALLLFLIPIILALAASNLLPQIPNHLRADPIRYQQRLSAAEVRFKNWTPVLEAIGAFYIEDTLWFRLLLAGATFVLCISLGRQISALFPLTFPGHSQGVYRLASNVVVYLGLLLSVAGLAINGRWGWQRAGIQMPQGEAIAIGPAGDHRLEFLGIETAPTDTLHLQVDESRPLHIRWGRPRWLGRFRYEWVSRGDPFVQIHARDADGDRLTLYNYEPRPTPVETLRFAFSSQDVQESDPVFIMGASKSVGRLAWLNRNAANDAQPRFFLSIFDEDGRTPLAETEFRPTAGSGDATDVLVAQVDDITYLLDVTRYVVVNVAYRPGLGVLWVGGILLAAGLLTRMILLFRAWGWHARHSSALQTESEE